MSTHMLKRGLTFATLVSLFVLLLAGGAAASVYKASLSVSKTSTEVSRDVVPPTITCPPDTMFECDAVGEFGEATATDDVDPDPVISYGDTVIFYRCPYEYTFIRTWTATDASGNSASCDQTVIIQDGTPPEITCPENITIACDKWEEAGWAVFHDDCNPNVALEYTAAAVVDSTRWHNKILRHWEVTDSCCNLSACSQIVTLIDTIPPVLTCAQDDTIPCDAPVVFSDPEGEDNCSSLSQITYEVVSIDTVPGPEGCEFTVTRCSVARDHFGNVSEPCCHSISVADCGANTCTFTMGGWGSDCPRSQAGRPGSTQPGCVRDHYFDEVFPDGVMIGDTAGAGYGAVWTSPAAVAAFLPDGATPGVLTEDLLNPTSTPAGVLGGQVLALKLNRGFSCAGIFDDLGVTTAGTCYGELMIPADCGAFAGLTVDEFLAVADQVIAGDPDALEPYSAGLSDLVFTATCLNERFDDCERETLRDLGGLPVDVGSAITPEGAAGESRLAQTEPPSTSGLADLADASLVRVHPNPVRTSALIDFNVRTPGRVRVDIYDVRGFKVTTLLNEERPAGLHSVIWRGTRADGKSVARGVYFCRIQIGTDSPILEKLIKAE